MLKRILFIILFALILTLILMSKSNCQSKYFSGTTTDTYTADTLVNYRHFIIVNDSTNSLIFSFDSTNTNGIIKTNETLTMLDVWNGTNQKIIIWIKSYTAGAPTAYRLWGW